MPECQRCSECRDAEHHWLPNPGFGDGDEPDEDEDEDGDAEPQNPDYAFVCKHCPAVGGECPECDGDGVTSYPTLDGDDVEEDCPKCLGWGVIEGLAFTEWRDDA